MSFPEEAELAFAAAARHLAEAAEEEGLEVVLGPLVDGLLLAKGVAATGVPPSAARCCLVLSPRRYKMLSRSDREMLPATIRLIPGPPGSPCGPKLSVMQPPSRR